MVNKQYNVQNSKAGKVKNYSPPPKRDLSAISTVPNPLLNNLDSADVEPHSLSNVYVKNINEDYASECPGEDRFNCERVSAKELSMSDIGRFQYILQMDKEMVRILCGIILEDTVILHLW
ncbi:hypothetical protein DMENIID0001_135480 [Sergentomyia squamirostris]